MDSDPNSPRHSVPYEPSSSVSNWSTNQDISTNRPSMRSNHTIVNSFDNSANLSRIINYPPKRKSYICQPKYRPYNANRYYQNLQYANIQLQTDLSDRRYQCNNSNNTFRCNSVDDRCNIFEIGRHLIEGNYVSSDGIEVFFLFS